jgi:predicted anti-sigma-YlaC factor YlaD
MICNDLRTFLDTTLAEERTSQQMEDAYQHARQCPACNAYLQETLALERQLGKLPSFSASAAVMRTVMARVLNAPAEKAPECRSDLMWWAMLLLSLSLLSASYCTLLHEGRWLDRFWTLRLQMAAPLGNLLSQPWPAAILCALGASLAAVAILWRGSRTSQSQAPRPRAGIS